MNVFKHGAHWSLPLIHARVSPLEDLVLAGFQVSVHYAAAPDIQIPGHLLAELLTLFKHRCIYCVDVHTSARQNCI